MANVDTIKSTKDIGIQGLPLPPGDLLGEWSRIKWVESPVTSSDFGIRETSKFYNEIKNGVLSAVDSKLFSFLRGADPGKIEKFFVKGRDHIEITKPSPQCWAIQKMYNKQGFKSFWSSIIKDKEITKLYEDVMNFEDLHYLITMNQPSTNQSGANFKGDNAEVCWLCGGKISKNGGAPVVCFQGSQCEHILPAGIIQVLTVLPIIKYNSKINKSIKKMSLTKGEIRKYVITRSRLLLSFFDWAHPYCNQLKKDKPLVMPQFDDKGDLELEIVDVNIKRLSKEILFSEKGISANCKGEDFRNEWWGISDADGDWNEELFQLYTLMKIRCEDICSIYNSQDPIDRNNCSKISIITTFEQIKERLNKKWTSTKPFLKALMQRAGGFKGGGELTVQKIDGDYQRDLRNYDRNIVQEIINSNYVDELIKNVFGDEKKFMEFLSGFDELIKELNEFIDNYSKEIINYKGNAFGLSEKVKEFYEEFIRIFKGVAPDSFTHYTLVISLDNTLVFLLDAIGQFADIDVKSIKNVIEVEDEEDICIPVITPQEPVTPIFKSDPVSAVSDPVYSVSDMNPDFDPVIVGKVFEDLSRLPSAEGGPVGRMIGNVPMQMSHSEPLFNIGKVPTEKSKSHSFRKKRGVKKKKHKKEKKTKKKPVHRSRTPRTEMQTQFTFNPTMMSGLSSY